MYLLQYESSNSEYVYDVVIQAKLHYMSSIFSAEATAILKALEHINQMHTRQKYAIVTDSMSSLDEITSLSLKKNEIISQIVKCFPINVILIWVPSHMGVIGNIFVDRVAGNAKFEVHDYPSLNNNINKLDYKNVSKNHIEKSRRISWNQEVNNKYFCIHPSTSKMAYNISRKEQMIINRLRAGHTYITHSYKMAKENEPICISCQSTLTVQHIFECKDNRTIRKLRKWKIVEWKNELFEESKLYNFFGFLKDLDYYQLI